MQYQAQNLMLSELQSLPKKGTERLVKQVSMFEVHNKRLEVMS